MNPRKLLRAACASVAILTLCTSVQAIAPAGLFRAYVASTGNDANPCTLTQPCRLLPAALTAITEGGEIWMLDSANFNTSQVNITRSVTILAIPGAIGSVVATGGGDGININAPGVTVTLRNLVIVHLTWSANGVNFVLGTEVNVADCEIANVQGTAISASASNSRVTVKNTGVRGASTGFYAVGSVLASLDGVHIKGSGIGVLAQAGSRVTVSNSVLSGNGTGATAETNVGTTRLVIERSVITGNGYGIVAQSLQAADVTEVTSSWNTITHNSVAAIYAYRQATSTTTIVADGNTVTENEIGFFFGANPPTIYTRGNNTLKFNTNDLSGGSLTALAGQ